MKQIQRKLFHLLTIFPFFIWSFFMDNFTPRIYYIFASVILIVIFLAFDLYRFYNKSFNQKVFERVGHMFKDGEREHIASAIWGPIDLLILTLFFSKITVVSTFVVAGISDPVAAVIGMKYGGKKNANGKTWAGTLAYFLAAALIANLVNVILGYQVGFWLLVALSAVAAAVERYVKYLDDNFAAPIIFALLLEVFLLLYR